MKKSRIFMASGAIILAISSILATKANKKFAPQLKTAASQSGTFLSCTSDIFTVSSGVANYLQPAVDITTVNGSSFLGGPQALYTAVSESNPVYVDKSVSF
jgi:hypothetical protein